jgi:beta-glucosidase
VALSDTILKGSNKVLKATIKVTNTGKIAGEETVQVYLRDPVASVARPVKELKQFKKLFLLPGETKEVSYTLMPEDLKFYNSQLLWDWESGTFIVYIGSNAQEVKAAKFIWNK